MNKEKMIQELAQALEGATKAIQNFSKAYNVPPSDTEQQCAGATIPTTLEVTTYGKIEPINDTMSKGRVRIFYTGLNRNRTYISEDFANQLIASLPYAPVKGIFDKDSMDYTDHGEDNSEGRIYGLVMAEPNFAWEDHVDIDGVTRRYACADVLYYTGLYPEAKLIPDESQSMEIYKNSLVGEWRIWEDGQPYYHFEKGCLLGLQVLGMETEPCFEGAAFYSLKDELQILIDNVKNFSKKEDDAPVERTLFRLSDKEKAEKISIALNPNFNEEGNWEMSSIVLDVYDDYALIGDIASGGYKRAYYTKDGDNITVGDIIDVKIVDVSDTEYAALEAMKAVGGTYEAINTVYTEATEKVADYEQIKADYAAAQEKINELETKNTEFQATIESNTVAVTEFKSSIEALEAEKVRLETEYADLNKEKELLAEFKVNIETEKKNEILSKFSEHLTDEMIEGFKKEITNYSIEDFKKEVCTAAFDNDPDIFNKSEDPKLIYTGGTDIGEKHLSGMERILNNYKRGGNR